MEIVISVISSVLSSGLILFFVQRYFSKKDKEKEEKQAEHEDILAQVKVGIETLRLLSFYRMSHEIDRLLLQGYATSVERRILGEMYKNYKDHGWNGDMDSGLQQIYELPYHPPKINDCSCDKKQ